uniref:Uncharacterized protein n=1 Tax=Anabas testudineus TaxID=64144 RepID=A0A3Q1H9W2_ANATE
IMEILKTKLDFPSPVIQAQVSRCLIGRQDTDIVVFSPSYTLEALWQQCCSDYALIRSACCDAVVLLVDQGHADLHYILNSVLNLLPSARNVQGLIKVVGRMLQMQADQRDQETHFTCPYSIRSSPHPYITALENRVDCWPALLLEIDDFIQNEPAYVTMLAPFLRYLYCEPQRQPQHALLRHGLLRVLLPVHPLGGSVFQTKDQEKCSAVSDSLLRCLCQLVPYMQVTENQTDAFRHQSTRSQHLYISFPTGTDAFDVVCLYAAVKSDPVLALPLSSWYSELSVALSTLRKVADDPAAAADWLLSVRSALSVSQQIVTDVVLFSPVCWQKLQEGTGLQMNVVHPVLFVCVCLQVPSLIPVLLFKLGKEKDPGLSHAVLNCLPSLGTHKLCVPMVLQTLNMLASAPKLRAVAMRLMTALWKKQDRVYPELQRLLGQHDSRVVVGRDAQWEQFLARAACIRDVCTERPYQHGGDMLAAITLTLSQCTRPDMATPAALALQGLRELCRAEVVDIISTWRSLGPELSCDYRPLVVRAVAELLALVPQLTVKSEEYEVHNRLHESFCLVAICGYRALAEFPEQVHTITFLPEAARPATNVPEDEDDEQNKEREEEERDLSIPGSSYVKLMALTHISVLPGFELFLTSLVKQEMSQMPRGVYFSALRGGNLRSDQGKTVAGIPSFMLKTYEKNKQPGLKPGLAAGLLLCYELPVQTDRDGKPIDRFLINRSRSYQQTLTALIHEGRRADLEMQQKQGKENPEELQYKLHCAWLWARDQLADVIKAATKDSPVVQGNSILALSSLAAVLAKYESNLPAGPEFVPTASWLAMVLDTLLSIISSSYKARGQVFPWFLHRSYSGENTASAIARSCASLALSLLVPVLVVWQRDGLHQVLSAIRVGLPDSPTADDSQAVQFHSGLALGMVLSSLHHQRLSTGCLLGLGLVLAALCTTGQTGQHVRVTQILDKLLSNLQDSSGQGRMQQEVLAYTVACVGVSAFRGSLIDAAKAEEVMNTLRTLTEESQQTPGFSLALGLVVHGLSISGHGKAEDIHPRLLAAWIKILLAEGCPTMQRLAAVNGLVALVGSESYLIQVKSPLQSHVFVSKRTYSSVITFSGAIGLQSNSVSLLGHLHLAHMSTSHSHTAVPQDFSYLSEKSVIRSIIDFLTEAGKKGPEFSHPALVKTALTSLASVGASFQYPPINWSAILTPLMRLGFGADVQHQCVVLAECQAQSSQSASLFLGSWLSPPLVHSLSTRAHLFENLGLWMKHVAEDKLQVYMESLGLQQFQEDLRPQRLSMCCSLLQGLAQAMAMPNPSNNCWTILCSTTEKIFNLLPNQLQVQNMCFHFQKPLVHHPNLFSREADAVERVSVQMEKSCFVLTYLISQGRVPLLGLNDIIAGVLRGWPSSRGGWFLLQTFYQCRLAASSITGVSKRMEWLLELMGHIRNVAYGVKSVTCGDTKLATDFLFHIFAAAVVSWGDHLMPLLLGIRAQLLPWQQGSKPPHLTHSLYGKESLTEHTLPDCLLGMPHSLALLLDKEPWSSQTHKFIDWLFSITEGPDQNVSATTISTARGEKRHLTHSAQTIAVV